MPRGAAAYLLDGDPASRRRLAARLGQLGFETWPFDTVERFLSVADTMPPACIIVAAGDGFDAELVASLVERTGGWPVIVLDPEPDVARAVAAIRAGAVDYLAKEGDGAPIERALRTAADALDRMLEEAGGRQDALARLASLTPREKEVATALLHGLSNKRAAHALGISVRTVEMHRSNVMAKLGVRNIAEAAVLLASVGFGEAQAVSGREGVSNGETARRRITLAA